MKDEDKTGEQLISELRSARERVAEVDQALSDANKELFQVNVDLQREQVLERLRGQAQGMQSSEDIKPVVEAVYHELSELGLPLTNLAIGIYLSETEIEIWDAAEDGRALEPLIIERSPEVTIIEVRRRGEEYRHRHLEGEEVKETLRRFIAGGSPRWTDVPEEGWPQKLDVYRVFFDGGRVGVSSEEPIAEEHLMLIKRFGEVFGFAHSRWEELKQKEAQNRQLITEAALERVRSSVTSMTAAADLGGVVEQMLKELETSGVDFDLCVINLIDEGAGVRRQFGATPQGWSGQVEMPLSEVSEEFLALWREGKPVVREVDDALAQACFETRSQMGVTGEMVRPTAVVDAPFAYGTLSLQSHKTEGLSEKDIDVVAEFARVVALGYARYLDFQRQEENLRQLERDKGVERIRAEAMAMRSSDDLPKLIGLLWEEMVNLGMDVVGNAIRFVEEDEDGVHIRRRYYAFPNPRKFGISWTSPHLVEFNEEIVVRL